jgi:TPR repeat protein
VHGATLHPRNAHIYAQLLKYLDAQIDRRNLAIMYAIGGPGVPQDERRAEMYYRKGVSLFVQIAHLIAKND